MAHFRPMDTGNRQKVRRIAIVGPESTGKTDLANFLANHYQTAWVPEFARAYLEHLGRPYTQADLLTIAQGQLQSENLLAERAKQFLFCDTNLIVIKIWSEFNYHSCDPSIITLLEQQSYDLHLLTDIDLPWEDDPLREHPDKRQELFDLYESELNSRHIPFVVIRGEYFSRRDAAIQAVEQLRQNSA